LKYGIDIPSTVKEAHEIDDKNGNTLWGDAIKKELSNVRVAFQLVEDGDTIPVGSKLIPYHIIFDVKIDLTRKARLVAGGRRIPSVKPHASYSSVASRDSTRLCFMLAALNEIDILMGDIGNAYLNAPNKERVHVICGPKLFGPENQGKKAVIVRALYGLKTAGNSWRQHFSAVIREQLGYESTVADPDVYRKVDKKSSGELYYSYLEGYVDDVLCIQENPKEVTDQLASFFRLKDNPTSPFMYLGTDIRPWTYQRSDGSSSKCWALGANTYVKEAIRVVETQKIKFGISHSSTRRNGRLSPFNNSDYRPELDMTNPCDSQLTQLYQNLIGVARWICELGRIDILHEVSFLSQYMAQPRKGHLTQLLNILFYLKHHERSWMVLDPSSFEVEGTPKGEESSPRERTRHMKEIYTDAEDTKPYNMPLPLGKSVDISVFVDADHAGNKVTRRSHTGIIVYCNLSPILWYSKRQNTVETSTFGSEFVALRIATEIIEGLLYKLRMFGVPINNEAKVFCDNKSVVKSSAFPESTSKKNVSIAFHRIREAVAAGKMLIYYEASGSNLADLLTKVLPNAKRMPLVQAVLS